MERQRQQKLRADIYFSLDIGPPSKTQTAHLNVHNLRLIGPTSSRPTAFLLLQTPSNPLN